MHAFSLAHVANTFCQHAESQVALECFPSRDAIQAYWLTHRFRHEYWNTQLAAHRAAIQKPGVSHRNRRWREITPVLEEILLSEPLSRCIAYHANVLEEEQIDFDFGPLAHNVLNSHIEARHRCLHLIVFGSGLDVELAVRLNRMRRVLEMYSDQLIAYMRPVENLEAYCFDPEMTAAAQLTLRSNTSSSWRILGSLASARWLDRSLQNEVEPKTASGRLNHRLSQIVLELLPNSLFDGLGIPQSRESAWLSCLSRESDGVDPETQRNLSSPLELFKGLRQGTAVAESTNRRW